jgi:hypothetical protein
MPRVKVETMRADFAASLVTGSTPAEKQVYRNAMAVCDAMTSDMDARANAQAQAKASSEMPTLSTGGDIDESMPMRGWDAGGAGNAIRKKQKQDRKDADRRARQQSAFVNSSAYTSWVKNGPNLRDYVMGLYTRQVEIEALYIKNNPPPAGNNPAASGAPSGDVVYGTFAEGKSKLIISPDHTAVHIPASGQKEYGAWSVNPYGHFQIKFQTYTMKGHFSDDGKKFTTLRGAVYTSAD